MSKILLIVPFDGRRQASPTLGVGYLEAYARKYSSNSLIIHDENFLENPNDIVLRRMGEIKPDFIGISFPSSAVLRVRILSRLLKEKYPNVPLFAGGYHPTSEPERTLKFIPEIDFVVRGEGEKFVAELNAHWQKLPNVAWLEDELYRENPVRIVKEVDGIPFPDRKIYDKRYFHPRWGTIAGIFGRTATLLSSRGCPYACNFCSNKIMQKGVRFHSTSYVLSEIEHILSTAGKVDYLYFLDTMFLAKWERVENLCQELIRSGFSKQFKWAATVAANVVDEDKVSYMKAAGCFYLSFGFESNSPRILKIINKMATCEDNKRACEICNKHGIYVNSAFLFGIPGEEEKDLKQTVEFVKTHNISFTGVNIMKPLPGSPFYYDFVKRGIIKPSIDEWYTISSVNVPSEIYNNRLTKTQYDEYIGKFYRASRRKGKYSLLSANWRTALKYFFENFQGLGRKLMNPNTTTFTDFLHEEYKKRTQAHWTKAPCGSNYSDEAPFTLTYFEEIEDHRYRTHPWIKEVIESFDIKGKKVLEIGIGMGTDNLNLARRGANMHGIDLTPRNLEITKKRLSLYGLNSQLVTADAENLPYADNSMDFIYSFGVIHHSPDTERIISEIHRVLKPGGRCWVTVYNKNSIFFWWSVFFVYYLLLGGWCRRTLKQQLSLIEYPNTDQNMVIRLYTQKQFRALFRNFSEIRSSIRHLLPIDIAGIGYFLKKVFRNPDEPARFWNALGEKFGWYIVINAIK
jgi:radical SAM superfamily enzyme YgiQ (UPF0313 family)/ubiquinone/menaquinone biosynthesis C-methylase UbiE